MVRLDKLTTRFLNKNVMTNVNKMPELLAKMSVEAYQAHPIQQEQERKRFEMKAIRLHGNRLRVACINHKLIEEGKK